MRCRRVSIRHAIDQQVIMLKGRQAESDDCILRLFDGTSLVGMVFPRVWCHADDIQEPHRRRTSPGTSAQDWTNPRSDHISLIHTGLF
jgi:hypothetical protein